MKIKAIDVFAAMSAVRKLQVPEIKLPVKADYWLSRIGAKLHPEFEVINSKRNALISKHGEVIDGTPSLRADSPNVADFAKEWEEIALQEIEIDCPAIKLSLFGDAVLPGGALAPLAEHFITED